MTIPERSHLAGRTSIRVWKHEPVERAARSSLMTIRDSSNGVTVRSSTLIDLGVIER
jgi:hypothetical protein